MRFALPLILLISVFGCSSFEKPTPANEASLGPAAGREPSGQAFDSNLAVDELQKFLKIAKKRDSYLSVPVGEGQVVSNTVNGAKGRCGVSYHECQSSLSPKPGPFCRDSADVASEVSLWITMQAQGVMLFELSRNPRLSEVTGLAAREGEFLVQTNNWASSTDEFRTERLEITRSSGGTLFKVTRMSKKTGKVTEMSCLVP